jgi:hypothetical protein
MPIATSINNFNIVSGYVYRACWMTEFLRTSSQITPAQAAAVLASWNANIKAAAGAPQLTLPDAADKTQEAIATWWNTPGSQMKSRCDAFGSTLLSQFLEQDLASHPCSNWGVLIVDFTSTF